MSLRVIALRVPYFSITPPVERSAAAYSLRHCAMGMGFITNESHAAYVLSMRVVPTVTAPVQLMTAPIQLMTALYKVSATACHPRPLPSEIKASPMTGNQESPPTATAQPCARDQGRRR